VEYAEAAEFRFRLSAIGRAHVRQVDGQSLQQRRSREAEFGQPVPWQPVDDRLQERGIDPPDQTARRARSTTLGTV